MDACQNIGMDRLLLWTMCIRYHLSWKLPAVSTYAPLSLRNPYQRSREGWCHRKQSVGMSERNLYLGKQVLSWRIFRRFVFFESLINPWPIRGFPLAQWAQSYLTIAIAGLFKICKCSHLSINAKLWLPPAFSMLLYWSTTWKITITVNRKLSSTLVCDCHRSPSPRCNCEPRNSSTRRPVICRRIDEKAEMAVDGSYIVKER